MSDFNPTERRDEDFSQSDMQPSEISIPEGWPEPCIGNLKKRCLDDFVFIKDAGFSELYETIGTAVSRYNEDTLDLFCNQCRLALEHLLEEVFGIAGHNGYPDDAGPRIGRLKAIFHRHKELFPNIWEELLTGLNQTARVYHHKKDYPPREQWNSDAQLCYLYLVKICYWLVWFKDFFPQYIITHDKIDYKEELKIYTATKRDLPEISSIANKLLPDYDSLLELSIDEKEVYKKSLQFDLAALYDNYYETAQVACDTYLERIETFCSNNFSYSKEFITAKDRLVHLIHLLPGLASGMHVYGYFSVIHPIMFYSSWSPAEISRTPFAGNRLSADEIYDKLINSNSFVVRIILGKLECPLAVIEKIQEHYNNRDQSNFTREFKKVSCDISFVHDFASFIPFLVNRDYGLLLKPKETAEWLFHEGIRFEIPHPLLYDNKPVLIDPPSHEFAFGDKLKWLVSSTEKLEKSISSFIDALLSLRNDSSWGRYYSFEQQYLTDILNDQITDFKELQFDCLNDDRQKHIRGLQKVIEKGRFLLGEKLVSALFKSLSYKDFIFVKEYATSHGLITENRDDIESMLQVLELYSAAINLANDIGTGLETITHNADEAVSRGIISPDDPFYFLKAICISAFIFNNETRDYSLSDVESSFVDCITHYKDELATIPPEASSIIQLTSFSECQVALVSAIEYVVKNYPLGLTTIVKEDPLFERAKYMKVRSFAELSDFVKKMTPYGQRRLLVDLECPFYCEEDLLKAILSGDQGSFKQICSSEKLKLIDDFAIVIGFIINVFEEPLEALYNIDFNNDEKSDGISDEFGSRVLRPFGLPDSFLQDYYEVFSDPVLIKRYLPFIDINNPELISQCARLIGSMVSSHVYLEVFEPDEIIEVNKLLDNPKLNGLLKLTQYHYFSIYKKWPSKTPILLSPEEQIEIENEVLGNNVDKILTNSQARIKDYYYTLPEDLFTGKVDILHDFISGLNNAIKDNEVFEPLFNYIIRLGGICTDKEAGALLRVFTGYPVENANDKAKWETDYHILYYLIKYMFTPKKSYVKMSECIDINYPSDDERQKAEKSPSSYAERISGSDARSIIETLHRLSDIFPKPITPLD